MKPGDLVRHKKLSEYGVILTPYFKTEFGKKVKIWIFGKGIYARSPKHFIILTRG